MKEKFENHRFNKKSLRLIEICDELLTSYEIRGYKLSIRQLYYQLVQLNHIENTMLSYKRTVSLVSDARLAGLLDWDVIEDRGRELVYPSHWSHPGEILVSAAKSFRLDRWIDQPCYIEVFVEKNALSGVLIPVCNQYDVRFTANRGYASTTLFYEVAKRLEIANDLNKNINIIYAGDHDPSGIHMSYDISTRLELLTKYAFEIHYHRVALNYDQVQQWNLAENPAKESDTRFKDYEAQFGSSSWELDAIKPETLADLVSNRIQSLISVSRWNAKVEQEQKYKNELERLSEQYNDDDEEDSDYGMRKNSR